MATPTVQHAKVKPQKLADIAVGLLDREVVIPNTFAKKSVNQFKGAEDDTLNFKVPGVLPFHEYGWRNDRSEELKVDSYTERKIALTFGGDAYSAVRLTDEQNEFDEIQWSDLLGMQARAVGRGLENGAVRELKTAPYGVVAPLLINNISGSLVEARRIFTRLGVPGSQRLLVVGSDIDALIQADPTLTQAMYVGDANANVALRAAITGKLKDFTILVSNEIEPDAAYAYTPDAFAFLNAAPAVPQSVPFGATSSFNGISLRWLRDYETMRTQDRSVVNTWYGFQAVTDVLRGINEETGHEFISEGEHFVRGIKLQLIEDPDDLELGVDPDDPNRQVSPGGLVYPTDASELGKITGIVGLGKHLSL